MMTIEVLAEELKPYRERMRRKSKAAFRRYLRGRAEELGLGYRESDSRLAKNVIIGDLEKAEYVLGAHYDTAPRLPAFLANHILLTNILIMLLFCIAPLLSIFNPYAALAALVVFILALLYLLGFLSIPNKHNANDNTSGILVLLYLMSVLPQDKAAYIFFDNEEKGLVGSFLFLSALRKNKLGHRRKKFIILDCVGRGKLIRFTYIQKNSLPGALMKAAEMRGEYRFKVKKGSLFELSDHFVFMNYPHVGIFAYEQKGKKYRIRDIHCRKDRDFEKENIAIIADIIYNYMQGGE